MPFADACFALHRPWINLQHKRLRELTCELYLAPSGANRGEPCVDLPNATYLKLRRHEGLSDDPGVLQSGGNSGFGALNLAYLKRAKRIALFGFDYRDGHYCADRYTWYRRGQNDRYWPNWARSFNECLPQLQKAGVEVVNASPNSAIDAFPKLRFDNALDWMRSG